MNLEDIQNVLEDNFKKSPGKGKKRHVIFWFDVNGDFADDIDDFKINNAKIWKLNENNNFKTKYQLEIEDKDSNYLIYSSNPRPRNKENWLLDTIKYSQEFSADKITLIMRDFGVEDERLRSAFKKYKKFFNNKIRYNRLKDYDIQNFDQVKLDEVIFSAFCKLKTPDIEAATRELLMESLAEDTNDIWTDIEKFGDADSVWNLLEKKFGYHKKDKKLKDLMLMLLFTHLRNDLKKDLPENWQEHVSDKETECVVFISQWMNHAKYNERYDELARKLEKEVDFQSSLDKWHIEDYIECDTFEIMDKKITSKLIDSLLAEADEFDKYKEIIKERRTKHWYNYFTEIYEAIFWAVELMQLRSQYEDIKQEEAFNFVERYKEEYYLFDKAYRKFYTAYDQVEDKSDLSKLREKIEKLYSNWYLQKMANKFTDSLEEVDGWPIPGLKQQKNFFSYELGRFLVDDIKVFVIISDGLRYEAAAELEKRLNENFKASTELLIKQGSLPSTTSAGMASLLPNKKMELNDNQEVLVDGKKTNSTAARRDIISSYIKNSAVLKAEDVKQMTRDEMRDAMYGKQLIYIYHNRIDALGDNPATEDDVFLAVEEAFNDIESIVKALTNNVSATNIIITSDHGFIYRRGELKPSDKTSKKQDMNEKEAKRYKITKLPDKIEGSITIDLNSIFTDTDYKIIVPRGVNRFQAKGRGSNYVHGGASLQEIVIPVIKFKNDRSDKDRNIVKKVDVKLTSITRKITNSIFKLEFFQKEKISAKKKPRRLLLYFEDNAGNRISNENVIIADSSSDKPEDRTYREKFTLKSKKYESDKKYYLVMEDEEESVEKIYEKIPFKISLVINQDFDF